jgi:hypothetical protein
VIFGGGVGSGTNAARAAVGTVKAKMIEQIVSFIGLSFGWVWCRVINQGIQLCDRHRRSGQFPGIQYPIHRLINRRP